MKKIVTIIFLCLMTVMASAQKQAILVVQFGTSNDEGRAAALDVLFSDIKARYPQYEVREAYTSPTIRRILAKKNVKKLSLRCSMHSVMMTIHGTPLRISQKRSMNRSTLPPK